ncbi:MAG: archaeosine biosynthesis radical SAM protein RaSEA, partial [Promethearchaeota archaeon]
YYSEKGGCFMCGYNNDTPGVDVPQDLVLKQFTEALSRHELDFKDNDDIVLKIFNSGSFFDNKEISEQTRQEIFKKISEIDSIKEVALESRPEFLTEENVASIRDVLDETKRIEVGIGLESWNDTVRNDFINKQFSRDDFLNANSILTKHDVGTKVYLLLKPPFLSERVAHDDVLNSVKELVKLKISTISINPTTVHSGTLTDLLWNKRLYTPPRLWTIRLLLHEIFTNILKTSEILLISGLVAPGQKRGPSNCEDRACNQESIYLINESLKLQESIEGLNPLDNIPDECNCIYQWIDEMEI